MANARPPGRAKLDEAPLPGLTRGANAPQLPGGWGLGAAAGIDLSMTSDAVQFP
mgnify:FL=1